MRPPPARALVRAPVCAIVLAAGAGRRLGGPKALACVAGRTFISRVLTTVRDVGLDEVVVVAGADADAVVEHVRTLSDTPDVRWVRSDAWADETMADSLRRALELVAPTCAALVWPVDVPCVHPTTVRALLDVGRDARPVVRRTDGVAPEPGHPVVASAATLALVRRGAILRDALASTSVVDVPVADAGVALNVNRPRDLRAAEALARRRG